MNVELQASQSHPRVKILALRGRLSVETEARERPRLFQALQDSPGGLILDFQGVDFVSSAGLRLLLEVYKQAAAAGVKMAIIRPQPEIYKLFKLAALEATLAVHEDAESAARAMGA